MSPKSANRSPDFTRLTDYGWSDTFASHFRAYADHGLEAGRAVSEHRRHYTLQTTRGAVEAELAGRLLHRADDGELPVDLMRTGAARRAAGKKTQKMYRAAKHVKRQRRDW